MVNKTNVATGNPHVMVSTADVLLWENDTRGHIGTAPWLTGPLVSAELLPRDYVSARIAPIVIGKSFATERIGGALETVTFLAAKADTDYLATPPKSEYFPHENLKKHIRAELDRRNKGLRKPQTIVYPGYVMPDVGSGSIYLDGVLGDTDCTTEAIRPTVGVIGRALNIGTISVGEKALIRTPYSHIPFLPLPSVIREALKPDRTGRIQVNNRLFQKAAETVLKLELLS